MKKDYYGILKIDQEADPGRIKRAYRRAAKRYHPDISPKGAEKFKEIQEAYETLSDPEKKTRYDRQLQKRSTYSGGYYRPVYSEEQFHLFSIFGQVDRFFASFGHLGTDDFYTLFGETEERRKDFSAEIILTPTEAEKGCRIPLKIPLWINCSRCGGTGRVGELICGLCRGRREEAMEKQIRVTIPPGVKDGTEIRIPVDNPDSRAIDLLVTIRISSGQ